MAFKDKFDSVVQSVKESIGMEDEHDDVQSSELGMSSHKSEFRKDFTDAINSSLDDRIEAQGMRPNIELWPYEDDFGHWVAAHENRARAVICSSPEFRDTPYCGTGLH